MNDLSKRIANLPPEKRAELLRRLEQAGNKVSRPTARVRDQARPLPLSFSQQRLWLLYQFEPSSVAYNLPNMLRIQGRLDTDLLERALRTVLERHESLRTTFRSGDQGPEQVVAPSAHFTLERSDLTSLPAERREEAVQEHARAEAQRPFDLTTGPLLRAGVLRLGEQDHVLLVVLHHIVTDGWSFGVLARELLACYDAFSSGKPLALPPLPVQYPDFALWQRERLQGAFLQEQVAYWRKQFEGAPTALELPTDHPRPALPTGRGQEHVFALPRELSEAVRAFATREGASSFMVLMAAFNVLMSRYSGQEDVCVGTPVAGRSHAELEGLIGFFINTVVIRSRPVGGLSFRQFLKEVRESSLGAFSHQEVPVEKLIEELRPAREQGRNPLFQVVFALLPQQGASMNVAGLDVRMAPLTSGAATFELTVLMSDRPEGFTGRIEYSTDLFEPETIARMAEHLRVLISAAITTPERKLSELPLLSEDEQRKVLVEWNDTRVDYPRESSIHALFEAQAARTPDAIAVEFQGAHLTYRQLDSRSNQLAHHLLALGLRPGQSVALCVERSLEMVVSTLAILKAGAAYVPLDPSYPRERLEFMLQDVRAPLLLVQRHLAEHLPSGHARLVVLESDAHLISQQSEASPGIAVAPEALAYVMYTSGSTGLPKGVCIPHRGVVRLVMGARYTDFGPREVMLQLAPISFDAATFELWGSLLHGGKLVVLPPHVPSIEELSQALKKHGITLLFITSALFDQVVATQPEALAHVRQVFTGGDVLVPERAKTRLAHGGQLVNAYGPTESTTFATCHLLTRQEQVSHNVPIGRPISNTQVYVLDARLQPVPAGVHGELYIGGDGLAWGYLNRPELSAERFVPNPFALTPGERLYRTGDKVRWLDDGTLEFAGRLDSQVKLRGFRIELGEIESVLGKHPSVRQCTVIAREDRSGDKRLVAYVVSSGQQVPSASELRAYLKEHLPEYMVPSAFVALEQLPVTPSGKVDRKALPMPEASVSDAEYIAPRTPTEQQLATIWAEVLGVPRVGAEDNFLDLGGHSLLATQVMARLRPAFEVELPIRALFEAPTLSGLARKIDEARARRPPGETLVPAPRPLGPTDERPLSFAQQRLWFLDQLEPNSPFYNIPSATRLSGPLDIEALRRAFEELVRRHESLRTTFFISEGGLPAQAIAASLTVPLDVLDLQDVPASEREPRARELARQEALRPFNLAQGPLVRTSLLRLAPDDHVLLVTQHHIVSDGWSMGVLVREVAALYAAFASGRQPALPPLPMQYADFALWQRSWLQGEVLDTQLRYWKQQLSGAPAHLELPTDKPRPSNQTYRGAQHSFLLPPSLSQALATTSARYGVSPFMTLLAAFQVLLHRYSGQDDLSVGSPIAGRRNTELEGLIGFFVNTLVLRSRISAEASFRELLLQVRDTTLAAYEHQDLPFEKLVEQLHVQRDPSRPPVFQVMFALQNMPVPELTLGGLKLSPLELDSGVSKFDLSLFMQETPRGLRGFFEYNTDLFEPATITQMAEHLRVLLSAVVAHPETRLSELPLLSEDEKSKVLVEWNDTRVDYPRESSIHALFEAQAARTPDAIAVEFQGSHLTYRQLDSRSNQLAHHLLALGLRPGQSVALCVERSLEMVISTLAILKAGAAYVPLDPSYPRERLEFMLQDVRAPLLLAQRHLAERLPLGHARLVVLDSDAHLISQRSEASLGVAMGPEALAYVMYTSGSTGLPKGVCIPHRGVVRLVMGSRFADFGPREVMLQLAPISFDAATLELWGSLLHGGKLVVLPPHAPSIEELSRALKKHGITTLWLTAALFDQVMATQPEALAHVRQVLTGGDVLIPERARTRLARGGQLVNAYGPTESTTFATCHLLTRQEQVGHNVPIGRPISNTQVYVLDARLQPVPAGVHGELYIGGDGLAWGYLNRPELSAEKFVPHPFALTPGERLYRTGDRVRWLADGTLEFSGRLDSQVKLRGFRIELGEIESVLDKHPSVRQCVVIAREDRPGDKRLVAYVTSSTQAPSAAVLRAYLKEHLPEYMVPSAFVALEQLPLTPSGKVDRKALPVPEATVSNAEYIAPRTPTEEQLATIWAEVLSVPRVGAEDNFFELGGHSLMATQVISRLRSAFAVELPVRALFEASTLSALARKIDEASAKQAGRVTRAPALKPMPRTDDSPLSFAQQRLWFLDQFEPGSPFYNIPAALRLSGPLDIEALRRSFEELVRRHESLRTTFISRDGQPAQVIAPTLSVPMEVLDLQDVPTSEREPRARELIRQEALRPFELANGPLVRTSLLRLASDEHVLLVTQHHIISDGWSMGVLVREVAALYAAFASGQRPALPPLPIQYADYALWQRSWLQGEVLDAQLGFWKQQLSGAPAHLELATDKPRPPIQTYRGAQHSFLLSPSLSQALATTSTQHGVSLFMTLLAGFQVLLHRYTGQDDLSVGSPIAGRRSTELEGLIGFFINTLVLRSRISPDLSFRELLQQVRDTTLAAYEHQDVPFEKLVEELQPQRDPSRPPLFQVMFALQNMPIPELALGGLTLSPLEFEGGISKFDLSLFMQETSQGLRGVLEYNTDLFEPATITRMAEHLQVLLSAVVASPGMPVSRLPLLPEAEKHKLLVQWNDLPLDYPREATLHELFEAQVERTPDAEALVDGTRSLTYAELNARANQLAHSLRSLGVGPETPVGICSRRSADLVVGLLGILKAGGLYVPLDPAYPASVWASSSRTPSCASSLPSPTSPTACLPTPLTCCCSTRTRRRCRAHLSATPRVRPSAATSPTSSTPRAPRAAPRASPLSTAMLSLSSSGLALSSLPSSSPACWLPPPSPSTCLSSSSSSL
ncbi:amino acid adenylation domain-containing protein [Archangium violaceum]|nr:amino acid adenylation domain-containing protein [Archangium violaceum]